MRDVALREILQRFYQREAEERQQRQPLRCVAIRIQMFAQRLQLGDVDFLDVGEMRDLALRRRHAFGNHAPHADDLYLFNAGRRHRRRNKSGAGCTGFQEVVEVLAQDAAARPGTRHQRQIDVGLFRATANGRRRHHARPLRLCRLFGNLCDLGLGAHGRFRRRFGCGLDRGLRRRRFARFDRASVRVDDDQRSPDRDDVARFARQFEYRPADRRRQLDRRFVGHHGADDVFLVDVLAHLDEPLADLRLDRALAEVRQLEHVLAHSASMTRRIPADMRFRPGKYCHSKACG